MGEKKDENKSNSKRKKETRSRGFYMRMTPSEIADLDILSYACEESKTDVMRKAFKLYYDLNKNKL